MINAFQAVLAGNHYILLAREKGSKYQNIKQKNDKANHQSLLKVFVDKR